MEDEGQGPRYWWWNADDLADMWAMLVQEGSANLRLEFHPRHPDYDGEPIFVLVDTETGEPCGSYNHTQTCPPTCP